jgi:hypothetical protein
MGRRVAARKNCRILSPPTRSSEWLKLFDNMVGDPEKIWESAFV